MKRTAALLFVAFMFACNNGKNQYHKPEDATDCFRSFVSATMEGRFDVASEYLLQDSTNNYLFGVVKKTYEHYSSAKKDSLKNAAIIINETAVINDSTTIFNFRYSTGKDNNFPMKVIKRNNEFWVDLKYTQSGNL